MDIKDNFLGSTKGYTNVKLSAFGERDTNTTGSKSDSVGVIPSVVWTTEKINDILNKYNRGEIDIRGLKKSPFLDNNDRLRRPGLIFELTKEEKEEWDKCASNPLYFAEHYAQAMTEEGNQILKYRPYEKSMINTMYENRYVIMNCSRQVGKTITTSTFLVWYILFQNEKTAVAIGDVWETTKEMIEKMKTIIYNLPFFMKPGIIKDNESTIRLENGSRILGRTTTKKSGIGFAVNLLFMDEFAHIDPSFLNFFYRNIYPTIESFKESKIIITSTPNGANRFHKLWTDAIDEKNSYVPVRVDWWQVPGRDEEWKKKTIANLGSEEDFKQNYGLQFFIGDNLLLNSSDLKKIDSTKIRFNSYPFDVLNTEDGDYREFLKFHPVFYEKYLKTEPDLRNDPSRFVISIDTADGVGRDYSVINIFKIVPLPISILNKHKTSVKDINDIFSLMQVGYFRTNKLNADKFCHIVTDLIFRFFNFENVRVVLELNHKGEMIHKYLQQNGDYYPGLMIHSKHTMSAKYYAPGIILNSNAKKAEYCDRFRNLISLDKILLLDTITIDEVASFGKIGDTNTYRSQTGNDDMALTSINTVAFFDSPQFYEFCEEVHDAIEDDEYLKQIEAEFLDYNMARDNKDRELDMNYLNDLNGMMN